MSTDKTANKQEGVTRDETRRDGARVMNESFMQQLIIGKDKLNYDRHTTKLKFSEITQQIFWIICQLTKGNRTIWNADAKGNK